MADLAQTTPAASVTPPPALNLDHLLHYHRHEDTLFDRRLYSLLVGTAFLVAGFAQFRQREHLLLALTISVAGCAVASVFAVVLWRTTNAIKWSNQQIRKSEAASDNCRQRIYSARDMAEIPGGATVLLGRSVPLILIALWIVLASVLLFKHALDCSKYYPCPWFGTP